jgi:hypothetical protein
VTADWPLDLPERGAFVTKDRCASCGHRTVARPDRRDADPLCFDAPASTAAADVSRTPEGFGLRHEAELILSQRAFGVRDLRLEPILFRPRRPGD